MVDDYAELEIYLKRGGEVSEAGGRYAVELHFRHAGGQADIDPLRGKPGQAQFDFRGLRAQALNSEQYGRLLWEGLFGDVKVGKAYAQALSIALAAKVLLRVRLLVDSSAEELHRLHWEMLRDPQSDGALCMNQNVLFSRYLSSDDWRVVEAVPKHELKAAAMAANPSDLGSYGLKAVDVEGELGRARDGLGAMLVEELPRPGKRATLNHLVQAIQNGCEVVYLVCHGKLMGNEPWLWLEDGDGKTRRTSGAELVEGLQGLRRLPLLFVLASCESGGAQAGEAVSALGPRLAEVGVPAVLAMQGQISMESVATFMPFFFEELSKQGQVDQAAAYARWMVRERPDHWAPALFMRLKTGRIFKEEERGREEAAPAALFTIPDPPVDFVGREGELEELLKGFGAEAARRGATITGLTGGAGVGKTALARVLARELAGRFPDARMEINLQGAAKEGQTPVEPAEVMRRLLGPFYPGAKLPKEEAELRGLYLDTLREKRALLVLDNARNAAQVRPLLPPVPSAAIVTARANITLSAEGLRPLRLGALPLDAACMLLREAAPRLKREGEEAVRQLAEACGRLPLALRVAGSLLEKREDWTVEKYLSRLADERKKLRALRDPGDPDLDVEAALGMSYEDLEEDLQWKFRMLGVFPAPFELEAARAVWECEEEEADEALGVLLGSSLAEGQGAGMYRLHDLTRAFAMGKLWENEEETRQAGERHAGYYLEAGRRADDLYQQGGEGVMEGLERFREAWPHLQAAWRRYASQAGDLLSGSGGAAAMGEETWPSQASSLLRERWLSRFPDRTTYVIDYVATAREQIPIRERAVQAARALGYKGAEGRHLGNLGVAYAALGETRRAIEYYEQQLVIAGEIGDRRQEGNALGNLGNAYRNLGEIRRAIEYHEQALAIAKEIGERRMEGILLGSLGLAYVDLGETWRAIQHYEQALRTAQEIGDRQNEGAWLGYLGNAYRNLGEIRRAIEYHEQALAIAKEIGDRGRERARLGSLGLAYVTLGETRRAIEHYAQALRIDQEIGDRGGEALRSRNLGLLYEAEGEYARAAELMRVCVDYEKEIGHPDAEEDAQRLAEVERKARGRKKK